MNQAINAKQKRNAKKKTVFVLVEDIDYDRTPPLAVFATKEAAEAFVERCKAHVRKKPEYPPQDIPDDEFEKLMAIYTKWQKAHPIIREGLSDYVCSCDTSTIEEVRFYG